MHAARGRSIYLRLPILLFLAYVFVRHIANFRYQNILLYPLTVGAHALGQFLFSWSGEFIAVLAGVTFQFGAPVVAIFIFYLWGDFFALFFSFGWLSTGLFLIARYITDAQASGQPLVGPFSGREVLIVGDWNYFLTQAGLLPHARLLALFCQVLGIIAMLICLTGGAWYLILAKKSTPRTKG